MPPLSICQNSPGPAKVFPAPKSNSPSSPAFTPPSPPSNNSPRKFSSPNFPPRSLSASRAPKTSPPSANGLAPAPSPPTNFPGERCPPQAGHSPECRLHVESPLENPMKCSRALYLSVCFSLCTINLAAQTPPPQKPEIEVPSSQTACDCHDLEAAQARIAKMDSTLKDWPDLARYRDANTKIAPLAKGERRAVFMGDSITDAWVRPQFGGFFPGKPYIDRGISGQTTPQMLIRFRPDVIALQPKVVVILAGTNDIAGNTGPMTLTAIEDNLMSMFDLAHANGIRVVFASLLPISDYEKAKDGQPIIRSKQRPPDQITALNAWMKTFAAARGSIYLDYFSAMADEKGFLKEELTEDGLHP